MKNINDQVVIYPTDTVWGIGGSVYSEAAYNKIAEIKKTNLSKPLSIMFYSLDSIKEYFNLPVFMSDEWINEFFKLESTLGLPVSLLKKDLPLWLTNKSSKISIRFVNDPIIREIGDFYQTPFFTTSLNLTAEDPITSFDHALSFKNKYAKETKMFGDKTHMLSGESSSIVFYYPNDPVKFVFIRNGRNVKEIKAILPIF